MASISNPTSRTSLRQPAQAAGPSRVGLLLACLALIRPLPLIGIEQIPLPFRAVSAILCGLAVLLCGSYLIGQVIDRARPVRAQTTLCRR